VIFLYLQWKSTQKDILIQENESLLKENVHEKDQMCKKRALFLDGKRANLDGMLEEARREHRTQNAQHPVFQSRHAHLSRLNGLHQPLPEELSRPLMPQLIARGST
jgi:hypothetical protein